VRGFQRGNLEGRKAMCGRVLVAGVLVGLAFVWPAFAAELVPLPLNPESVTVTCSDGSGTSAEGIDQASVTCDTYVAYFAIEGHEIVISIEGGSDPDEPRQ